MDLFLINNRMRERVRLSLEPGGVQPVGFKELIVFNIPGFFEVFENDSSVGLGMCPFTRERKVN